MVRGVQTALDTNQLPAIVHEGSRYALREWLYK